MVDLDIVAGEEGNNFEVNEGGGDATVSRFG